MIAAVSLSLIAEAFVVGPHWWVIIAPARLRLVNECNGVFRQPCEQPCELPSVLVGYMLPVVAPAFIIKANTSLGRGADLSCAAS